MIWKSSISILCLVVLTTSRQFFFVVSLDRETEKSWTCIEAFGAYYKLKDFFFNGPVVRKLRNWENRDR